ncbi:MAG: hypothetical protein ACREJ2_11785, partial [Planctomycetota bacterium]
PAAAPAAAPTPSIPPAPSPGTMAWADIYALFEGRRPNETPDGVPARIEVSESLEGPWQTVGESEIHEHSEGWHFGLHGHARFSGTREAAYVRFSAKKGLKGFRLAGHILPPEIDAQAGASTRASSEPPLEIEHVWFEDDPRTGRRERRHRETVTGTAADYTVPCAAEPHDAWITLRLPYVKK